MTKQDFYGNHNAGPEWATPPTIWKPLANAIGGFDLDPASGCEPEPIADTRFTVQDNGLERPWFGHVWVNPPYGREFNDVWANKITSEAGREDVRSITALIAGATEVKQFHKWYVQAQYYCFVKGRVSFIKAGGSSGTATFPSLIVVYGSVPKEYLTTLQTIGHVVQRWDP